MAKEEFRIWKFRGNLKVKYCVDRNKGIFNYWEKSQEELLNQIIEVVEYYMGEDIKLTNRQLYYQLVAKDFIPNALEVYKRFCTFLTDARYGGLVDWEAIEDRGRIPEKHSEWDNIKRLIQSATYTYRLPRWKDQEYYVELYCEKQAMESVLKPIAEKYHIYFGFNKGYSSASTMYDLAQRIKEKIQEGKRAVILYLGDHDPSGLDMVRDVTDRIKEFLIGSDELQEKYNNLGYEKQSEVADDLRDKYDCGDIGELYINDPNGESGKYFDCPRAYVYDLLEEGFKVVPLALNMQQIKKYNCPPNPAKITDPRARGYIEEHGNKSWELDALEPKVLMKIAEKGIKEFLDEEKYNVWIEREKKEIKSLEKFGESLLSKRSKK